jgi:hypothetical protein
MKTLTSLFSVWLVAIVIAVADDPPVYQWSTRLELTKEQQQLLRLYGDLENPHDAAAQAGLAESVKRLVAKLASDAVRPAKPGEVTVTRLAETDIFAVHNPSNENVALTIAVKGDEQPIGTKIGSIGRSTYLPPFGTLIVPKLYWTTPRTSWK